MITMALRFMSFKSIVLAVLLTQFRYERNCNYYPFPKRVWPIGRCSEATYARLFFMCHFHRWHDWQFTEWIEPWGLKTIPSYFGVITFPPGDHGYWGKHSTFEQSAAYHWLLWIHEWTSPVKNCFSSWVYRCLSNLCELTESSSWPTWQSCAIENPAVKVREVAQLL